MRGHGEKLELHVYLAILALAGVQLPGGDSLRR